MENNKAFAATRPPTKHKRRFCKVEGCERIVKSQGLCQRHGAKPCTCKVPGCSKQAQGNFNGMCKAHFRSTTLSGTDASLPLPISPKSTRGLSSLPDSPLQCKFVPQSPKEIQKGFAGPKIEAVPAMPYSSSPPTSRGGVTTYSQAISSSIAWDPQAGAMMPLVAFLKSGYDQGKLPGWHRADERASRGYFPTLLHTPLDPWELEMLLIEILILTGNSQESFRYLAHAWGQPDGFHRAIGQNMARGNHLNEISDQESDVGEASIPAARLPPVQVPRSVPRMTRSQSTSTASSVSQEQSVSTGSFRRDTKNTTAASPATNQNRGQLEMLIALLSSSE